MNAAAACWLRAVKLPFASVVAVYNAAELPNSLLNAREESRRSAVYMILVNDSLVTVPGYNLQSTCQVMHRHTTVCSSV